MAKDKLITFVLHDETLNTHGFRMLTSGANLEEFHKNPVMLWNHDNWELPIGRWENIRIEGTKILADANFDLKDPKAAEIARKVEAGYIKACSIGAWAVASSTDASVMLAGQKYATVTEWVVREASICTIGANHNALSVALYDAYGTKINMESSTDIETIITLIDKPITKTEGMNKQLLELLNLADNSNESEVLQAVQKLSQTNQELSAELKGIKEKEAAALKEEAVKLTDEAIKAGKLAASAKESTLQLFALNHEAAKAMINGLPERPSIANQINNSDKKEDGLLTMSWTEIDKANRLAELKEKYPEEYREKFKECFGREPR
ncbi:HK97 family phage prohead protease [Porphyromonadaceae bacterium W3.11]|nr:HK97 family phage prohead protease [Porphyromonadaceae bacterium W3.11]MDN4753631.1 HK97 family phage prohead protease [Porphyromonadaceae bacterium W3.11]MDN4753845.1 HK97 family phage prohead protease [Porphyromonadaceae bacterium W3.11]